MLWPLREGVYPQGPGQRRNRPYAIYATRIRCRLQAFLHSLSPPKENQCPRKFYFASSYTINSMNMGKDLLVWVGLVNGGLIFIPSPGKMIIITNKSVFLSVYVLTRSARWEHFIMEEIARIVIIFQSNCLTSTQKKNPKLHQTLMQWLIVSVPLTFMVSPPLFTG